MSTSTLPINEIFGPTYQGEGPDIGKPCIFVRVHHCPVKCPGCDTYYTWDGSEQAAITQIEEVSWRVDDLLEHHPNCGIVVSGGEPLLYHGNTRWCDLIASWRYRTWVSIETSGFVSPSPVVGKTRDSVLTYLGLFNQVVWSPKITPALRGQWIDAELTAQADIILDECRPLALKFVVGDEADLEIADRFCEDWSVFKLGLPVYVMPFGITTEEVQHASERLLPLLATSPYPYILTPRLHSLLWGARRGV